jgi:hypothetical protein
MEYLLSYSMNETHVATFWPANLPLKYQKSKSAAPVETDGLGDSPRSLEGIIPRFA